MAVNSLFPRDIVPEVNAFKNIISSFHDRWNTATTLEDRDSIESQMIEILETLLSFSTTLDEVSILEHPDVNKLNNERVDISYAMLTNTAKISALAQMYLDYFNSQHDTQLELIGAIKRNRQKLATLKLWDRSISKWVLTEHFLNYDNLGTEFIKVPQGNVTTSTGYFTLPIQGTENIHIANITIASGSNGIPGSTDVYEVITKNRLPSYATDFNSDTWFEYERMDDGPLFLELECELIPTDIVNGLIIQATPLGDSANFIVEDIVYNDISGDSYGIRELVSPDLPEDFYSVKTIGNDIYWEIAHIPVHCKSIHIKIRQDNYYQITTITLDGRKVSRKRFAVAIKAIELKKHKFAAIGGINSRGQVLPEGLYAAVATANVFPRNMALYYANLSISLDGGGNWENNVLGLPEVNGQTLILDGKPSACIWSLLLTRNDAAFRDATSFTDEELKVELGSVLKPVPTVRSPILFSLPEKPYNKEVFVIQPKLARRTNFVDEALKLGTMGVEKAKLFPLPISLSNKNILQEELKIFVNGIEQTAVEVESDLDLGNYYLMPDEKAIKLAVKDPTSSIPGEVREVSFSIKEQRPVFTERTDGYYCRLSSLFDPDKENIIVRKLPTSLINTTIQLPLGKKVYNLGVKYIASVVDKSLASFHEVDTRADLSSSGDFYLDKVNGILYFYTPLDTNITLFLTHATPIELSKDDFDIWAEKAKPIGLIVKPQAMATREVIDILGDDLKPVFDPETGEYLTRIDLFPNSTTAFTLSSKNIVGGTVVLTSEVFGLYNHPPPIEEQFVDGKVEFLGLLSMEREYTPSIEGDLQGFVEFRVAAGSSYYSENGILFSSESQEHLKYFGGSEPFSSGEQLRAYAVSTANFASLWVSNGDGTVEGKTTWAIEPDGLITVYVGTTALPETIGMRYSYKDPNFNPKNRFSVDYENGLLYLSQPIDSSEDRTIKYKTADYSIAFDISHKIDTFEYNIDNNFVEVRTENLSKRAGRQIKVLWGKPPIAKNISLMKDYFSPIVHTVGLRFQ